MPTYKSIFFFLCSPVLTAYFIEKQEGKRLKNRNSRGEKMKMLNKENKSKQAALQKMGARHN